MSQQTKRPASKSVAMTQGCTPVLTLAGSFGGVSRAVCWGRPGREWGLQNQWNILTTARLLRHGSQVDLGLAWSKAVPLGLGLLTCKVGRVTPASQSQGESK